MTQIDQPEVPAVNGRASKQGAAIDARLMPAFEACPLLRGLDSEELRSVANAARVFTFPAQADVFIEGQQCEGLWIVASGRVRLYHSAPDGRQQVVSFRAPSASLELGPALDGRRYSATATVLEDTTLFFLPRAALVNIGRLYPVTVGNVIDQLCLELRQRDIATAVATLKDARGRIGCALLQLARQYGVTTGKGVRIAYRLTRQDIADRSGVTIETAIRVLSDLQRQGVVRTQAQIIEIVDIEQLEHPTDCRECQFDCTVFASSRALMAW